MNSRRTFIKQSALLAASVAVMPNIACTPTQRKEIGIQLYSLRDIIDKDVKGIIGKIAEIGYKQVETFGYTKKSGFWGLDAQSFSELLKQNGLNSPSGHFDFGNYMQSNKSTQIYDYIEAANILGSKYITVPYLQPALTKTADDFKTVAERLNEAAKICKNNGLKLAYHNHDFEFKGIGDTNGYEILLNETDQDLVDFELDLYWVKRSSKDPIKIFETHPGRFKLWHVKDMDKTNNDLNTELGSGMIDFKSIFSAAKLAGVTNYFVEHETNYNPNIIGSVETSFKYLENQIL